MYVPHIVQCSFNGRRIQASHRSGEIRYNSIMGEMVIMVKMVIMGEMVIMVKMIVGCYFWICAVDYF